MSGRRREQRVARVWLLPVVCLVLGAGPWLLAPSGAFAHRTPVYHHPKDSFRDHHKVVTHVYRRLSAAGMSVAITFDDGGSEPAWRSILATLGKRRVKATFFPTGAMVRAYPELAKRTIAEGHAIGNHSWDHPRLTDLGFVAIRTQVDNASRIWQGTAHVTPLPYLRPTYGAYDAPTLHSIGRCGYDRVIMWDVDTQDWTRPGAKVIARRAVRWARPGSIILMHTLPQTAKALPRLIKGLRRRGFHLVSLDDLFHEAGLDQALPWRGYGE